MWEVIHEHEHEHDNERARNKQTNNKLTGTHGKCKNNRNSDIAGPHDTKLHNVILE